MVSSSPDLFPGFLFIFGKAYNLCFGLGPLFLQGAFIMFATVENFAVLFLIKLT